MEGIHDVITHARFGDDRLRGSWVVWGSKFSISHWLCWSSLQLSHYRVSVIYCTACRCFFLLTVCIFIHSALAASVFIKFSVSVSVSYRRYPIIPPGSRNTGIRNPPTPNPGIGKTGLETGLGIPTGRQTVDVHRLQSAAKKISYENRIIFITFH